MFRKAQISLSAVVIGLVAGATHGQVAITEFMNNPDGADQGREWIELFNFGPTEQCLAGWTLEDEGTDMFALPDVILAPGGYLVLVSGGVPGFGGVDAATAVAIFVTEWFDGWPSPSVIGMQGMVLGNVPVIESRHEPRNDVRTCLRGPLCRRRVTFRERPRSDWL